MTLHATTARLGEIEAAWAYLREQTPDEAAIEWAHLIQAFKANRANGWGALFFNAGQGKPHGWKVKSEVTVQVDSSGRKA